MKKAYTCNQNNSAMFSTHLMLTGEFSKWPFISSDIFRCSIRVTEPQCLLFKLKRDVAKNIKQNNK